MSLTLTPELAAELGELYRCMEEAYDRVAGQLQHSCDGCPDNCCDSYFSHHTYIEWAYLWLGIAEMDSDRQREVIARAVVCERRYGDALCGGQRPRIMCPLNRDGSCLLYGHRLMVCRTHGVPATMTRPDGKVVNFPGCFRCQERVERCAAVGLPIPVMERTALLQRLVALEQRFLQGNRGRLPRLRLTIARMVATGPPMHLPEA